jgi:hypothetical protein
MSRANVRRGIAGLFTGGVFLLVIFSFGPTPQADTREKPNDPPRKPRPEGKPVAMPANLAGVEIHLGLKDKEPTAWNGEVQLSQGSILDLSVVRGGANAKVTGASYTARSVRQMQNMQEVINGPILRLHADAPPDAVVTLKTAKGKVEFKLTDLATGTARNYLDDQVSVERQEGAVRLTGRETEDDYPALAKGADGSVWLTYVEYVPGPPIVMERVTGGNFDGLVPTGNGDQVLLMRFDGKTWSPPLEVSDPGLNVWRPTVTVDGKGVVWVAWSQQVDGDWEIFHRRYTPPSGDNTKGQWSEVTRVTRAPGSDFHVVATTDSNGVVWLAWQGWRGDNFEILLSAQADGHAWKEPRVISTSKANDWSPAIAADSKGNVYVAYDTYDKGNYDVMLFATGKETKTIPVAASAKFEARPHIVCDAQDRVWIAYEEGDEQCGKDFSTPMFKRIPLESNPGFPLYQNRTVRVKCLADGKLQQPAGDLEKAFAGSKMQRKKSLPRLVVDSAGGLWLFVRHHPLPGGQGEVWNSFALRYDGKEWAPARRLLASANLLDNRPGLVPLGKGILTVYSGDNRIRTANRDQDDLFAAVLYPAGGTQAMELIADASPAEAKLPAVHPNETADVARMREARIDAGGKKLRLLRGEFHRHTEYTAHNDGDGLLEDAWRYALDPGNLDWMGVGDHMNGFGVEYFWWQSQKTMDLFNNPPRFVAVVSYERSVVYPDGHRNVILPKRGIRPLPFGDLKGTEEKGTPDTKMLFAYLKHFGGICASHTSATGMGTDWRDNDPEVEPIVEIYQGHRHNYERPDAPRHPTAETQIGGFKPAGFINNAFDKGYRFGFQASSDHISTHMSYGMVLTDDVSRQGIIDAFKKRHSYAATDNIFVEVRCGTNLMGEAFDVGKKPTLDITVKGTAAIAKVHIIRDNKYVYSTEPKKTDVTLSYTDMDAQAGKTSFYYVRIEQADGNLAWASPMWITYKP